MSWALGSDGLGEGGGTTRATFVEKAGLLQGPGVRGLGLWVWGPAGSRRHNFSGKVTENSLFGRAAGGQESRPDRQGPSEAGRGGAAGIQMERRCLASTYTTPTARDLTNSPFHHFPECGAARRGRTGAKRFGICRRRSTAESTVHIVDGGRRRS